MKKTNGLLPKCWMMPLWRRKRPLSVTCCGRDNQVKACKIAYDVWRWWNRFGIDEFVIMLETTFKWTNMRRKIYRRRKVQSGVIIWLVTDVRKLEYTHHVRFYLSLMRTHATRERNMSLYKSLMEIPRISLYTVWMVEENHNFPNWKLEGNIVQFILHHKFWGWKTRNNISCNSVRISCLKVENDNTLWE